MFFKLVKKCLLESPLNFLKIILFLIGTFYNVQLDSPTSFIFQKLELSVPGNLFIFMDVKFLMNIVCRILSYIVFY